MLNYMKSEFYRVTHSVRVYVTALVFAVLPLCMNLILCFFGVTDPGFPYSTTSFSFSNVVANPMIFSYAGLVIVFVLYEGSKRNGSMKNAVSCGISRRKIFAAQCLVSTGAAVAVMLITEIVYIGSAFLLLEEKGAVTAGDMLAGAAAGLPTAVSGVILGIVLIWMSEQSFPGILIWVCVMSLIPQSLLYLGLKSEVFYEIAMWMPANFFSGMTVNQSVCEAVWDTAGGFARCWIAGLAGILIFGVFGLNALRKKEL